MQADVFCRVIDNYGDIGVTWRLVRQLQHEHGWKIRLWVDDLKSFQRIEPRVTSVRQQDIAGIEIIDWSAASDFTPAAIVIATFSCDLPAQYLENMRAQFNRLTSAQGNAGDKAQDLIDSGTLWINLEYLSAEQWVEGCHGLPSLRADGLSAHFFFPGFNKQTGGLLREAGLIAQRDTWQADLTAQRAFLSNLGLSQRAIAALFPEVSGTQSARLINLFCYDNAPVDALLETLQADPRPSVLLIPEGIHSEYVTGQYDQLFIERVPFLPQTEYDKVLWMADLNFVRGEDSIVRGIWAGKPLIWQIYPQTENTHLVKLEAWLKLAALPDDICALIQNWNPQSKASADKNCEINESGYKNNESTEAAAKNPEFSAMFQQQLQPVNFQRWQQHAERFCSEQSALPDLATTLTAFCRDKQKPHN